ncbi:undecaprenyl-phosphate galactose phosphotransferase WbaP [Comamonas sp. JC664]|uniref:undecaprenyl-phosphate galactose phosphotransferase WbaP n=1 Tax=Comamonas sp. JC664 TaxID=2801917 RepID=UPI00174CB525|nr:undecaprenyl-phosphate galactose phosphotransferase WbaP [Comamonas sp. JC664]GHG72493.1 undecaprenyl-phosphate glucose phosphotransferase [Comamonas sp. KCTC 72670]
MFSRLQRFYTSIKVVADMGMLALAFVLAYATRFSGIVPVTEGIPPWSDSFFSLLMVLVIFPVTFHQSRLYGTNRSRTNTGEVFEVFKSTITAALILVAVTYFVRERYSRLTLVIFIVYAFALVTCSRLVFRYVLSEIRRRGHNLKSILVIGAGDLGQRVIETVEHHRELGFRVTGVLTLRHEKVGQYVGGVRVIGHVDQVNAVLDAEPVDQVILALPLEGHARVKGLMDTLALRTVDVRVVPDLYQYITLYGGLEEFGGLPIIRLQGDPMEGWSRVAKRAFDISFSLLAILVTAPLMLATALAVRLTSRGPMLYRQERMGMDGRTFPILKFRTMRIDAEHSGAMMARKDDPRRTVIGTFLRKYSLDELPQFFNVLRGDMSLVGPRPERPVFIEEFKRQIPRYHLRHKVKAGITGWAQINGLRGQTCIEKRIEYDLYYIENWSLLMDLKILVRTALGGFLSKNAY